MRQKEVLKVLNRLGVPVKGHFIFKSRQHSGVYLNKKALYASRRETSRICRAMAERFVGDGVEVVMAPATGGIILSRVVAAHLTKLTGRKVVSVYAVRAEDGESFHIRREDRKLLRGKKVLVVEDNLTTGGSVKEVVLLTREQGGTVIGVCGIWNRGGVTRAMVGNPPRFNSLVNMRLPSWSEEECNRRHLCFRKVPINKDLGKG